MAMGNLITVDDLIHTLNGVEKTYMTVVRVSKRVDGEGAQVWYRLGTKNPRGGVVPYQRGKDTLVDFDDNVAQGYIFHEGKFYATAADVPA